MRQALFIALAIASSLLIVPDQAAAQQRLPVEELRIRSGDTVHSFDVELALTPDEQRVGLMFRREMASDQGMLFVYGGEAERSMWMKNTVLPLDMLFIASDGRIVSVHEDAVPYSTDVIRSGVDARAVLELNAGVVEALDLDVGDSVLSESLGTAGD